MITIYNMDVLKALKQLPKESVDCVVTSPPYWALRDYGEGTDSIWGGYMDCEHEWNSETKIWHQDRGNGTHKEVYTDLKEQKSNYSFCSKCEAWRGQLGLEPTFDLFIKHLCDIFEDIKRVLKKDGTCWINLGDTYASKPSGLTSEKSFEWSKKGDGLISRLHNRYTNNLQTLTVPKPRLKSISEKSLCMIPFRFAIEMANRGWILRNTIIWHKPNVMPSSAKDRFTTDFEYLFFFTKSKRYYFETQYEPIKIETIERNDYGWDGKGKGIYAVGRKREPGEFATKIPKEMAESIGSPRARNHRKGYNPEEHFYQEYGRNKRCVWSIPTQPFPESHFAVFPEELIETPIKTSRKGAIVLDPFAGSGTTLKVSRDLNRDGIGIEIKEDYVQIIKKRLFDGNETLFPEQFQIIK